jgi:hypothetical protein
MLAVNVDTSTIEIPAATVVVIRAVISERLVRTDIRRDGV